MTQQPIKPTDIPADWQPGIDRHYRLQWEEAQQAYVLLYPEGMIKLNLSGGEILACCDGKTSVAQIIDTLETKFPDAGGLEQDIREFLTTAIAENWLHYA